MQNNIATNTDLGYVLSYSLWGKEYETLEAAKQAAEEVRGMLVWHPIVYGECVYHGDALGGYSFVGHKMCEIKFLENHQHCNHPDTDKCYYRKNLELAGD